MPYWKATYWQEKVSDLFIIVTTADRNLIYKNSLFIWKLWKDANRCKTFFYISSGSGDIREKHIFQKQVDVYFLLLAVTTMICSVQ